MRSIWQPCARLASSIKASSAIAAAKTVGGVRSMAIQQLKPEDHPWVQRVKGPASFLPEERIMTFIAANVTAGEVESVARDWVHLPDNLHGKGLEVILQAHALCGFPKTVNALIKVHQIGIHPSGENFRVEKHDVKSWRNDGKKTLEAVYGHVTEKMCTNFKRMHPLLESVMVEHIYGRVLSRPLLDLRMRELCTLAILAGSNVPLQMVSHLRGAQRCGASREEIDTVIEQSYLSYGDEALKQSRKVRDDFWAKAKK
mmetsp:Transcript_29667/g.78166  ORF Transcript_29667/g.78166 Transcript_29667/m.78166 type:complete len:257 (-) Transcript_29667:562-1332(-)